MKNAGGTIIGTGTWTILRCKPSADLMVRTMSS